MIRDMIQCSRWYPGLPEEERNRRIEADVELNWPLMLTDARKHLEQRKKL
jgi:predicted secreted Zn-dependent protease